MKRTLVYICIFMCFCGHCLAEDTAQYIFEQTDQKALNEFVKAYGEDLNVEKIAQDAIQAQLPSAKTILSWLKMRIIAPVLEVLGQIRNLLGPVLLLALLRCMLPQASGGSGGACFLLRLILLLGYGEVASAALTASGSCMKLTASFADAVAPPFTALLAAMGMSSSSALISPSAALVAGVAENLFLKFGLPLCRFALCTAIAGNLSKAIDLSRITALLKKTANWGTGLAITLFTAFLAIQGSVASAADSVTVRTAKYAVDSAAPVIGSGLSDAWDSYVSGVQIAKNAVGVSGIAAILAAGLRPIVICAASMLLLNILSALLEMLGEREAARAAEQVGSICQMSLSLSTGALAIAMVLLGAAMSAGRTLVS